MFACYRSFRSVCWGYYEIRALKRMVNFLGQTFHLLTEGGLGFLF